MSPHSDATLKRATEQVVSDVVLALDPGKDTGWVLFDCAWNTHGRRKGIIAAGIANDAQQHELRAAMLFVDGFEWAHPGDWGVRREFRWRPARFNVAIEAVVPYHARKGQAFFGKPLIDACVRLGRFIEAAEQSNRDTTLIPRAAVKGHLCGDARIGDTAVRQRVEDELGPKGTKDDKGPTFGCASHVWAALGVALTYADRHSMNPRDEAEPWSAWSEVSS